MNQPGVWIVGAAAMAMLVVLVTGLIIHRRFFKDFFPFRPRASSHRARLDVHNVTSVLVFPVHFIITVSSLVIFWTVYMPVGIHFLYGGNPEAMRIELKQRNNRVDRGEASW